MASSLEQIPIIPLNLVLFPSTIAQFHIADEKSCQVINQCLEANGNFGIVFKHNELNNDFSLIGTKAMILNGETLAQGGMNVKVLGKERFRVRAIQENNSLITAKIEPLIEEEYDNLNQANALALKIEELFNEFISSAFAEVNLSFSVLYPNDPTTISFIVSNFLPLTLNQKQHLLEITNTTDRLHELISLLLDNKLTKDEPEVYPITSRELQEWINLN